MLIQFITITRMKSLSPAITTIGEVLVDLVATAAGPLAGVLGFVKALGVEGANGRGRAGF